MSSLIRRLRPGARPTNVTEDVADFDNDTEFTEGKLKFVGKRGGNNSETSYQEASGAPVEIESPLGYSVGAITILFLNISKMIGTGIFSTRGWWSNLILHEQRTSHC